jgi:hypothetical protein
MTAASWPDAGGLGPAHVLTAARDGNGHLKLTAWSIDSAAPYPISALATASAGAVTDVSVAPAPTHVFGSTDVVSACRNQAGHLELRIWRVAGNGSSITQLGPVVDAGPVAGPVKIVQLGVPSADIFECLFVTGVGGPSGDVELTVWRLAQLSHTLTKVSTATGEQMSTVDLAPIGRKASPNPTLGLVSAYISPTEVLLQGPLGPLFGNFLGLDRWEIAPDGTFASELVDLQKTHVTEVAVTFAGTAKLGSGVFAGGIEDGRVAATIARLGGIPGYGNGGKADLVAWPDTPLGPLGETVDQPLSKIAFARLIGGALIAAGRDNAGQLAVTWWAHEDRRKFFGGIEEPTFSTGGRATAEAISEVAVTALTADQFATSPTTATEVFVTAVRNAAGHLEVISWAAVVDVPK